MLSSIRPLSLFALALCIGGAPLPAQQTATPVTRAQVQSKTVPRVIGLPLAEARDLLARAGIQVGAVTPVDATGAPAGTVVRQLPAAGTTVQPGASAQLYVAQQPTPALLEATRVQQRTVPRVVGMPVDDARALLARAGIEVSSVAQAAQAGAAPGTVLRQAPAAGTVVQQGMTAQLTVAVAGETGGDDVPRPNPTVLVPNVVGQRTSAARAVLLLWRLPAVVGDSAESTAPAGTVVAQDPAAGARVAPRTPVRLTLARGAPQRVVPDLAGLTEAEAGRALREAGLALGDVAEAESEGRAGTVVAQRPGAGTKTSAGAAVQVTLARAQLATVPDVRGAPVDRARVTLGSAGLVAGDVTTREAAGVASSVLAQSVAPGTRVARGSVVDLVVARPPVAVQDPPRDTGGVRVPDVTGRPLREALGTLRRVALRGSARPDSLAWTVRSQAPAAGTRVRRGASVTLTLREPPPVVVTPPPAETAVVVAPPVDSAAPVVTGIDSAAPPVVAPVDSVDSAAAPVLVPPPAPEPVTEAAVPPRRREPSPTMLLGAALLALALAAVGVMRWMRSPPQTVVPPPGLRSRGRWERGEARVSVAGKLVGGPAVRVRGAPGTVVSEVRVVGSLVSSDGGEID